jgi:hypothetical protein
MRFCPGVSFHASTREIPPQAPVDAQTIIGSSNC